ncbi:MAG: type II secretion system protein [Minisyncoccia bacterium]
MESLHSPSLFSRSIKAATAPSRNTTGFTLIELLVVLAIIGVISVLTIVSQTNFNKTLTLANAAYDVALTLRSAETFGIANSQQTGSLQNVGYGVYLTTPLPTKTFVFYADTNPPAAYAQPPTNCHPAPDVAVAEPDDQPGNCTYDAGDSPASTYTLGNGITISDFCANQNGTWKCVSKGTLSTLDIVYARPNPNPFLTVNAQYSTTTPVTQACITLTSPQGGFRYVSVLSSGEITVATSSCP